MGGIAPGRPPTSDEVDRWQAHKIKVTEYKVPKPAPEVAEAPVVPKPEIKYHNGHKLVVTHSPITCYRCEFCAIEGRIYLTPFTEACKAVQYYWD
jgi:hypothetical protein